jgi:hypothetical protein
MHCISLCVDSLRYTPQIQQKKFKIYQKEERNTPKSPIFSETKKFVLAFRLS